MPAQAPLSLTTGHTGKIPPDDARTVLRWQVGAGGADVKMSLSPDVAADTGITRKAGEGESIVADRSLAGKAIYFYATGTTTIEWDADTSPR